MSDGGCLVAQAAAGRVVVNGQLGLGFDEVQFVTVSNDAKHVAYAARKGTNWRVVVDGQLGSEYDRIAPKLPSYMTSLGGHPLRFSSDGGRIAHAACIGKKQNERCFVVVDGHAGPCFEAVGGLSFSPDGRRLAYVGGRAGRLFAVVDGDPMAEGDGIYLPQGTDAVSQARSIVTVLMSPFVFSPDSSRIAFVMAQNKREVAIVDGRPGADYDKIGVGLSSVTFSPDSRRVGYVASKGKKELVVIDGQPGPEYDLSFLQSGIPFRQEGAALSFSPDGKRVGFVGHKSGKFVVNIDGQESETWDGIRREPYHEYPIVFSPDSQHYALVAEREGKWHVVVNGQPGPA